jgi:hypothetical protein
MASDEEICPSCGENGISPWAWLYAAWPSYAKCEYCKSKIRIKYSLWFNVLAQLVAIIFIVFGVLNIMGGNYLFSTILISCGILSLFVPPYFGKLEIVK